MRASTATVAAALAAVLAPLARAHGTVTPAFAETGARQLVTLDTPNERERQPMTALVAVLPTGLAPAAEGQPGTPGWRLEVEGRRATWSGGSVPPATDARFRLLVHGEGEPRTAALTLEQRYPDGRTVSWRPSFTVLPASESPSQYPGRALVAAVVGLTVIGASLVLGRRLRRGSLGAP